MEKILDKFGIYDLFVNFITGIIMLWVFGYLQKNLYHFSVFEFENTEQIDIWVMLLLSYFVGIVFQETSNFIETVLYRMTYSLEKGKIQRPFLLCLIPSIDRVLMTNDEINQYKKPIRYLLRKKLKRDLDDLEIQTLRDDVAKNINKDAKQYNEALYNFCKEEALRKNKGSRLTNDQSHASMARSLALYSFVILVTSILALICNDGINIKYVFIIAASAISCLLFCRRNKRFTEMRYVSIFRACLYG